MFIPVGYIEEKKAANYVSHLLFRNASQIDIFNFHQHFSSESIKFRVSCFEQEKKMVAKNQPSFCHF